MSPANNGDPPTDDLSLELRRYKLQHLRAASEDRRRTAAERVEYAAERLAELRSERRRYDGYES